MPIIPLVSPVTSDERMKKISSFFENPPLVYCVSTTGTTGVRKTLPDGLPEYLGKVKNHFKAPRAVGFGISKPEHTKELSGVAEIAIIGSAVIDLIDKNPSFEKPLAKFIKSLMP